MVTPEIQRYRHGLHYDLLSSWWLARKCPVPDQALMPPTGFVIFVKSSPVCAGFLFKTDANIAIISHVVSSTFEFDRDQRGDCLNLLISKLILEARDGGFKIVSASSNLKKLNARYEALGFVKTDVDEVHYGRTL